MRSFSLCWVVLCCISPSLPSIYDLIKLNLQLMEFNQEKFPYSRDAKVFIRNVLRERVCVCVPVLMFICIRGDVLSLFKYRFMEVVKINEMNL